MAFVWEALPERWLLMNQLWMVFISAGSQQGQKNVKKAYRE